MTYTVIICPDCEHVQIVKDDPETTNCQRCQSTLKFRKLKRFYYDENLEVVQHARATIAAQKQGFGEEFTDLDLGDGVDETSDRIDDAFLAAHGLDRESIRTKATPESPRKRSRQETVLDALSECDPATEESIREYAEANGVPGSKALELLTRLHDRGDVITDGEIYRAV